MVAEIPIVITGTGLFAPPAVITNAELVLSLTRATHIWNEAHQAEIDDGTVAPRLVPDEEFIEKASGIKRRHVMEASGVLDPARLRPLLDNRGEELLGLQAEMALPAIAEALSQAGRSAGDVDAIIVGCSNLQRAYPAVSIEIQDAIGAPGWAYDMNVACSSATFAMQAAADALRSGSATCVLVVNPEITSGHNNFELRDFHFIFGDACTAVVMERQADARTESPWLVVGTKLATKFSNNIRNDAGFLNTSEVGGRQPHELLFRQRGQQVFREVCPMVAAHIKSHLETHEIAPAGLRRLWLHQANLKMNQLIAKGVLGAVPDEMLAPAILDEFANTSSAGSIIAFHLHREDLLPGDIGVICSFGAGYSVGSLIVQRA